MDTSTLIWILLLGGFDALAVFFMMRRGVQHTEHPPVKAEESQAVKQLRAMNAERAAKIEAARAKAALQSGETQPEAQPQ